MRTGAKIDFSPDESLLLRYAHARTDDPTRLMQNAFTDASGRPLVIQHLPASVIATRPGQVAINPTQPSRFTNKSDTVQATLRADPGFADLTSYTQYRKDDGRNFQDLDVTAANVFGIFIGIDGPRAFTTSTIATPTTCARRSSAPLTRCAADRAPAPTPMPASSISPAR